MTRRGWWVVAVLGLVLLGAAGLRLTVGSSAVGWPGGPDGGVIVGLRVDRLAVAAVVGVALSVAGVALQALLRNPLAEPFILGLSTGAAAGMMVQWWVTAALGWVVLPGLGSVGALVGAAASMGIVFAAGRRRGFGFRGGIDPLALLLTGVVLSTINGALIMLMHHLAGPRRLAEDLARWMMGSLSVEGGSVTGWWVRGEVPWTLVVASSLTAGGYGLLQARGRAMDVATLGPDEAGALGVRLGRLRVELFVVSSVLAAAGVVLAGPIAFVGLVCPHVARLVVGPGHRALLPASAVLGAALVVLADVAGAGLAVAFGVGVVPLGVFTALVGGVAFLWMLRSTGGHPS